MSHTRLLYALIVAFAIQFAPAAQAGEAPLIDDFGGRQGLVVIVDDLMTNLLADERTRSFFEPINRDRLKMLLVDQFCELLDGPCEYTGADMETAHRGIDINRAEFNALVEALQIAMEKNDIPFRSQNRLLALLAPMHDDIITP